MNDRGDRPVYAILGATGGIGSELCRQAVSAGAAVACAGRDPERLAQLAATVGGGLVRSLDATDPDQVEAFVRELVDREGRIDGIANCVGSLLLKPAHATSASEWADTIAANLTSAFGVVRAAGRTMRQRGGSVVLISSAAARTGLASHEAIAAAKAGVIGLARSAAASYASSKLRFNVVAPGLVETPLTAAITGNELSRTASAKMHALGRIGAPDEVARAILWFLDPAQAWVTGQVLGIDGGLATVRPKSAA